MVSLSKVDKSRAISEDHWVLSIVAKPGGRNPEHAILLVEGMDNDNLIFRRYDFVMGEIPSHPGAGAIAAITAKATSKKGLVVIKEEDYSTSKSESDQSNFFWGMVMSDKNMDQGCQGLSWSITKSHAQTLHDNVLEEQKNPPDYQLAGDHSAAASSSSQSGHNCYTWARILALSLNVDDIKHDDRLARTLQDLFASRTTEHIESDEVKADPGRTGLMGLFS